MNRRAVIVRADVSIAWKKRPPNYRIYVNDELFVERTWIWHEEYLEEMLPIYAPPGEYTLRWEIVPTFKGTITVANPRGEQCEGAYITQDLELRIPNEST
jgi:hypothetical protein